MENIKMNKNILCLYTAGLCGTWLSWFVNQHNKYPKFKYDALKTGNITTDICCDGATWCFTKDTQDGAEDKPLTWQEYLDTEVTNNANTNEYDRVCTKILPDHDLSWKTHDPILKTELLGKFSKVIVPYINSDSPLVDHLAYRIKFMWEDKIKENLGKQETDLDFYRSIVLGTKRSDGNHGGQFDYGKDTLMVNLHHLLTLDEIEYRNLVTFIDSEPLENYESYINQYRTTFICKDWTSLL
jgi:hypothetical protein